MQDWARPGTPPGAGPLPEPLRGPQGGHGPSVLLPSRAQLIPARLVACPFATGPLPGGGTPAMKLDFQHGTGHGTELPCRRPWGQLQRERYEADMKLIPNDATSGTGRCVYAGPCIGPIRSLRRTGVRWRDRLGKAHRMR